MNNQVELEPQIYEVTQRETGIKSFQASTNAEDACKQAGWLIGDCYVIAQKPRVKPIPDSEPVPLVKIPCKTCPFQFAECNKPENEECPARPDTPDLVEWTRQALRAHLCPYYGHALTKTDHRSGQKWVTMEEAINELSAKQ